MSSGPPDQPLDAALVARADVEDVCQDGFLAALPSIEECRPAHMFRG